MTFGPKRGLQTKPAPGTKVRFTSYFLVATGQQTGPNGGGRWLVVECECGLCKCGRHIAVNEPAIHDEMYDDVEPSKRPQWRHMAFANLERVVAAPRAEDQADELPATPRRPRR